jgi:hypothetical protein
MLRTVRRCNEGLWKENRRVDREKVERQWLEREKSGKGKVRNRLESKRK